MKLSRRTVVELTAGAALAALPRAATTQSYPLRPVHIMLGFPPGGSSDVIGRLMAQWLSERLGQPFIFDNRPGAGSNIGTELVARASPDGYTLLWATSEPSTVT
jgi:tripartite-type tricarboxylate transporter receptor subunit TctC